MLKNAGADVRAVTKKGENAFSVVWKNGHRRYAGILYAEGADVNGNDTHIYKGHRMASESRTGNY